jgi:hypothetical protein
MTWNAEFRQMRVFHVEKKRIPKPEDSLAERGGFEPPVPRGLLWAEFDPNLARYSARPKASVLERICAPAFDSTSALPDSLVRQIEGRCLGG